LKLNQTTHAKLIFKGIVLSKRINRHLLGLLAFLLILGLNDTTFQTTAPLVAAASITQTPVASPSCLPTGSPTAEIVVRPTTLTTPSTPPSATPSLTPKTPVDPITEDGGIPIFPDRAKDLMPQPSPVKVVSTDTVAAAQKMMQILLGPTEYACFDQIIWTESRWDPDAINSKNGACGLGQSNPCSKLENAVPDWPVSPGKQVKWFLDYMNRRYGSPCGAWDFWQQNGWY
jgi:hypothetical protein